MESRPSKALIALAALSVLLPIPGLSITDCIKQDKSSSTKSCILCYRSSENDFGSCSPFNNAPNCQQSNSGSSSYCAKCEAGYSLHNRACLQVTTPIANCLEYQGSGSSQGCYECSNGIPAVGVKSCLTFNDATTAEQPYLGNCASGHRFFSTGPARCAVCNTGYVYESTTQRCVSSTATGCWKATNGACISCRAWEGYFSDGFDESATGQPVFCRKKEDQTWITKAVGAGSADVNALLTNESLTGLFPRQIYRNTILREFANIKDGYIAVNGTTRNFVTNSASGSGYERIEESAFGFSSGEKIGYFGYYTLYAGEYRTSELFRCFYEKKMCLMVNDTSVNNAQTGNREFGYQEVFMFNITNPKHHGVIFKNSEPWKGKYVSNVLPITKSNYVILGFTTKNPWATSSPKVLLRLDYLDTKKQFEYTIPDTRAEVTCFRLLYIEYSKYFVASFSKNNGALVYDITQSTQAPKKSSDPKIRILSI